MECSKCHYEACGLISIGSERLCSDCIKAQLAAAEKRASEAESSNFVMKTALEKTKMGFEAFWINYKRQRYPEHQSDCQCKGCLDCRAVLTEADIALQGLPAAAQAVAEFIKDVLVAYDTWLGAVDFAEAVCDARRKYLAALDKEPTT